MIRSIFFQRAQDPFSFALQTVQSQNESRTMTVPQPFQYQGSKRALAPLILQYLPISTTRPARVAQPSPGRTSAWAEPRLGTGSSTVPVRVSTTGGSIKTCGGTTENARVPKSFCRPAGAFPVLSIHPRLKPWVYMPQNLFSPNWGERKIHLISAAPAGAFPLWPANPRLAPWAIIFRLSEAGQKHFLPGSS